MRYTSFWQGLKVVEGLTKLSAHEDQTTSREAQILLAGQCDQLFGELKQAGVVQQLMTFREAHRTTGEKLAAAPEAVAELLEKLATAVYVDNLLAGQLEKLAGKEYDDARNVQLLGREYAINLMRGLLA